MSYGRELPFDRARKPRSLQAGGLTDGLSRQHVKLPSIGSFYMRMGSSGLF